SYASSFDTIGVLSKTLEDNARVFEIMAGHDPKDSTSSKVPVKKIDFRIPDKKYKIAYFDYALHEEGVDQSIRERIKENIDLLRADGNTVDEISFPLTEYVLPVYYILTTAEASSNLERYDGVRYGYRDDNVSDLESLYKLSRSHGFGEEVKRRIFLGTFVLSANYYDAYYIKAQKARRLIREATREIFNKYDFILGPVSATNAFPLQSKNDDPLAMYLSDLYTVQSSVAGTPAISLPQGNDKNGLPIGIQVMADDFKEAELYAFSKYLLKLGCL
ncbi:MAG: amidase family protein, partial [Cyclobacteriaceae bacterium]|nr:amidase family protein [Cyclobacteriaceae bacterium]